MSRKPLLNDVVELLVDVPSDFSDETIPKGTRGSVVECYEQPTEGYSIDVAIPDGSLAGGFRHENVVLLPHQFAVRE
jgi:hypothetical protein